MCSSDLTVSLPILVVVTNEDGTALTPAQIATAQQLATEIPALKVPGGDAIGTYLEPGPLAAIPSQDGKAVLINVPVKAGGVKLDDGRVARAVREAEASMGAAGRVLLRPSGTEPVIRVMVEAQSRTVASQIGRAHV